MCLNVLFIKVNNIYKNVKMKVIILKNLMQMEYFIFSLKSYKNKKNLEIKSFDNNYYLLMKIVYL